MSIFKSLSDSELKKAKVLTDKEIIESLEQGRKQADSFLNSRGGFKLSNRRF